MQGVLQGHGYGCQGKIPLRRVIEEGDGKISNDDLIKESMDESWFRMGMTREEKWVARRPWRNSLIIKLVGRSVRYHYLWKRIQAMGWTKTKSMLIDLGTDFYIAKLFGREEYDRAISEGLWMIGENYLHVQK